MVILDNEKNSQKITNTWANKNASSKGYTKETSLINKF